MQYFFLLTTHSTTILPLPPSAQSQQNFFHFNIKPSPPLPPPPVPKFNSVLVHAIMFVCVVYVCVCLCVYLCVKMGNFRDKLAILYDERKILKPNSTKKIFQILIKPLSIVSVLNYYKRNITSGVRVIK